MSLNYYHQLDKERPTVAACMDDRGYVGDEQFVQIGAGGPVALASGLIVARHMSGHETAMPLGEVAKVATTTLRRQLGWVACTHHECAGEAASNPEVLTSLLRTGGELDRASIDRGIAVYGGDITDADIERMYELFAGISHRGTEREAVYMDTDEQHPAIERRHLVHEAHVAQKLEVIYDYRLGARTVERYGADPSYGVNIGALELASRAIATTLPHSTGDFIKAMSLHTGAIAGALPGNVEVQPILERV